MRYHVLVRLLDGKYVPWEFPSQAQRDGYKAMFEEQGVVLKTVLQYHTIHECTVEVWEVQ